MAIESKRIAKNTGLLYFRMILLMAVSLYTSREILHALGVVDYGLYNVVGGVVVMLGFLQGTMSTASSRFITVALSQGDVMQMGKVFSNILLVNILLSLVVILLAETIGFWFLLTKMIIPQGRIDASVWVYQFSVISVAINIVTVPFNASIISHERMGAFAYLSLFDAFAKLFVVFLINISPFDRLIFYSFLLFLVHIIDVAIYGVYCLKNFPETKLKLCYDKSVINDIFSFVIWASYGSFVSVGFTQGLNIILNVFFGPAVNAARGVAVQVQNAVLNFTTNFQMAVNPQLMKSTAQRNYKDAQKLLVASSKYSFYLLCALGIPLIVEAPFVLGIWLRTVPEYSVSFCRIILIISIWGALANPLRIVNHAEGNIKRFQLCECTLLLMIMPLSYFALKIWQIPILVFVIHFGIEIIAQFVRVVLVIHKIQMSFQSYVHQVYMRIVPVFVLTLLVPFCVHKCVEFNVFFRFAIVVSLCEILLIASILFWGLEREEIIYVKSVVLRVRNKCWRNL